MSSTSVGFVIITDIKQDNWCFFFFINTFLFLMFLLRDNHRVSFHLSFLCNCPNLFSASLENVMTCLDISGKHTHTHRRGSY